MQREDKCTFRLFFALSFPFTVQFLAMCIIRALTATATITTCSKILPRHCACSLSHKVHKSAVPELELELEQIAFHRHFSTFERCSAMLSDRIWWKYLNREIPGCCYCCFVIVLTSDGSESLGWLAGCQARKLSSVPMRNSACWVFTYTSAVGACFWRWRLITSHRNLFGSPRRTLFKSTRHYLH